MLVSSRRPRAERKSASQAPAREPVARRGATSDPPRGLLAERDEPLLAALAAHVDVLPVEVDVTEIERDRLGRAKPARVDELDERGVPERERRCPLRWRGRRSARPRRGRRLREPARPPRRERGLGHARRPERVADERSDCGEPARDRRRREPAPGASQLRRCTPRARGRRRRRARGPSHAATRRSRARSARYARRVASESAGLARNRSIAAAVSTSTVSRPPRPDACHACTPRPRRRRRSRSRRLDVHRHATTMTCSPRATGAVTLVGDSLNVGIEPYLREELDGWTVDAHDRVGRSTAGGCRRCSGELAVEPRAGRGRQPRDERRRRLRGDVPTRSSPRRSRSSGRAAASSGRRSCGTAMPRIGFNRALVRARRREPRMSASSTGRRSSRRTDSLLASDASTGHPRATRARAAETRSTPCAPVGAPEHAALPGRARAVPPLLRFAWRLRVEGAGNVPAGAGDRRREPRLAGRPVRPRRRARPAAPLPREEELWRNRLVGACSTRLGAIPVDAGAGRRRPRSRRRRGPIDEGDIVAIFPQGTVLGAADRPWQRGAARLALTTGAPLVPVAIVGAANGLRPGTRLPRPARVRVVIGEPIHVEPAPPTIPARARTDGTRACERRAFAGGAGPTGTPCSGTLDSCLDAASTPSRAREPPSSARRTRRSARRTSGGSSGSSGRTSARLGARLRADRRLGGARRRLAVPAARGARHGDPGRPVDRRRRPSTCGS